MSLPVWETNTTWKSSKHCRNKTKPLSINSQRSWMNQGKTKMKLSRDLANWNATTKTWPPTPPKTTWSTKRSKNWQKACREQTKSWKSQMPGTKRNSNSWKMRTPCIKAINKTMNIDWLRFNRNWRMPNKPCKILWKITKTRWMVRYVRRKKCRMLTRNW